MTIKVKSIYVNKIDDMHTLNINININEVYNNPTNTIYYSLSELIALIESYDLSWVRFIGHKNKNNIKIINQIKKNIKDKYIYLYKAN